MAAMQYYVGSWSCSGSMVGEAPFHATATFTMDNGILRQWVSVPPFGKMTQAYYLTFALSYDSKHQRYSQTSLDNLGSWTTSSAKPFTGNTEHWTDTASSDPKLGWGEIVRVSQNAYTYTGYGSMTAKAPNFKVSCTRSS
jgi:hypothetical protein